MDEKLRKKVDFLFNSKNDWQQQMTDVKSLHKRVERLSKKFDNFTIPKPEKDVKLLTKMDEFKAEIKDVQEIIMQQLYDMSEVNRKMREELDSLHELKTMKHDLQQELKKMMEVQIHGFEIGMLERYEELKKMMEVKIHGFEIGMLEKYEGLKQDLIDKSS
jgi:uncharacterized coiled-coil DUF342 family protein